MKGKITNANFRGITLDTMIQCIDTNMFTRRCCEYEIIYTFGIP